MGLPSLDQSRLIEMFLTDAPGDTAWMLTETVEAGPAEYSYGRRDGLADHLLMLAREFSGRPVLDYYHSVVTVRIRRNIATRANVERFLKLWRDHAGHLLSSLDSRWLISACDTFVDHGPNRAERVAALGGTLFMNTIKLYETERGLAGAPVPSGDAPRDRVALFDGMSAFSIRDGDMIRKLVARVNRDIDPQLVAPRIVKELVRRALANDTVFRRLLDLQAAARRRS